MRGRAAELFLAGSGCGKSGAGRGVGGYPPAPPTLGVGFAKRQKVVFAPTLTEVGEFYNRLLG